nr:54s ribosomal protein l22, mitochondrial [Quercus suber]
MSRQDCACHQGSAWNICSRKLHEPPKSMLDRAHAPAPVAWLAPITAMAARRLFDVPLSIRLRPFQPHSSRHASDESSNSNKGQGRRNPVLEAYQKQYESGNEALSDSAIDAPQQPQPGDISSSSIFEDDLRAQRQTATEQDNEIDKTPEDEFATPPRDPQKIARTLDLDPKNRERYERKKIIQSVRNGGRLTQAQVIKRTEREHLLKSHMLKTSQKKLGMLARQIAGKPIEEAILQMRFSKKKAALEVAQQLEAARDEAIVMRGMGLGSIQPQPPTQNASLGELQALPAPTSSSSSSSSALTRVGKPIEIQLKNGKRHTIHDQHGIYIDQAWIGRGSYGKAPDYRARGRVFLLRTPWTSISVVLKEEKTRIREHEAREAKRRRRALVPKDMGGGLWTHLPDRPVQWQRPWYTF